MLLSSDAPVTITNELPKPQSFSEKMQHYKKATAHFPDQKKTCFCLLKKHLHIPITVIIFFNKKHFGEQTT